MCRVAAQSRLSWLLKGESSSTLHGVSGIYVEVVCLQRLRVVACDKQNERMAAVVGEAFDPELQRPTPFVIGSEKLKVLGRTVWTGNLKTVVSHA